MKHFGGMTVIPVLLMSGCGSVDASATETERTICRELRRELPTLSTQDTLQTKREAERFFVVFDAVCHK